MTVQFIKAPGGGELAILPREDYEDLLDNRAVSLAVSELAAGREETLTSEEMRDLLQAKTPLAFWRRKREMSSFDLADHLGLSEADLASLEDGSWTAPLPTYRRAAEALGLSLDDLAAD